MEIKKFHYKVIALSLLFSISIASSTTAQPVKLSLNGHHIILLLDHSGSFEQVIRNKKRDFRTFLSETLPNHLASKEFAKRFQGLDRPVLSENDIVSVMLFGLPWDMPDFRTNYISKEEFLIEFKPAVNKKIHWEPFNDIGEDVRSIWNTRACSNDGWTIITAAIPMAIAKFGEWYSSEFPKWKGPIFRRLFVVRVSDDVANLGVIDNTEIDNLRKPFQMQNRCYKEGTRRVQIQNVAYLEETVRDVRERFNVERPGSWVRFSTNGKEIGDYYEHKIKVAVAEVHPEGIPEFQQLLENVPDLVLTKDCRKDSEYSLNYHGKIEFSINEKAMVRINSSGNILYELKPLFYRLSASPYFGEPQELNSEIKNQFIIGPCSGPDCPKEIGIEAFFAMHTPVYGAKAVSVKQKVFVDTELTPIIPAIARQDVPSSEREFQMQKMVITSMSELNDEDIRDAWNLMTIFDSQYHVSKELSQARLQKEADLVVEKNIQRLKKWQEKKDREKRDSILWAAGTAMGCVCFTISIIYFVLLKRLKPTFKIIPPEESKIYPLLVDLNRTTQERRTQDRFVFGERDEGKITIGGSFVDDEKLKPVFKLRDNHPVDVMKYVRLEVTPDPRIQFQGNIFGFNEICEATLSNEKLQKDGKIWITGNPKAIVDLSNVGPSNHTEVMQLQSLIHWQQDGGEKRSSAPFELPVHVEPHEVMVRCHITVDRCEPEAGVIEHKMGTKVLIGTLFLKDVTPKSFKTPVDIRLSLCVRSLEETGFYAGELLKAIVIQQLEDEDSTGGLTLKIDNDERPGEVDIIGKIPKDGVVLPLKIDIDKIDPPQAEREEYEIDVEVVRGIHQIVSPENEESAVFTIVPDRQKAGLYLKYKIGGESETEKNVPLDVIKGVTSDVIIPLADKLGDVRVRDEVSDRYEDLFVLVFGNQASTGDGSVRVEFGGKDAIESLIEGFEHDAKDLIAVRQPHKAYLKMSKLNNDFVIQNLAGKRTRDISFALRMNNVRFAEGAEEGSIEVRFPLNYWVSQDGISDSQPRSLFICFSLRLIKEPGPAQIAVDFGTSAIAAAFASDLADVRSLAKAAATILPLSSKLNEAAISDPNPNLISSIVTVNWNEQETLAYNLLLPAHVRDRIENPENLVPYIKKLIIRDENRILVNGKLLELPVLMKDVYAKMINEYLRPLLSKKFPNLDKIRRLVITHPNSFLFHHVELMKASFRKATESRLNDENINVKILDAISESDAVTFWYAMHGHELKGAPKPSSKEVVLIYDVGAGTLDISVRRITRYQKDDLIGDVESIELLALQSTNGAGNHQDRLIAELIDKKLKTLQEELVDIGFKYVQKICGEAPDIEDKSEQLPYAVILHRLKEQISELKAKISSKVKTDIVSLSSEDLFWVKLSSDAGRSFVTFDSGLKSKKKKGIDKEELEKRLHVRLHPDGMSCELGLTYAEIQDYLKPYYEEHVDELLKHVLKTNKGYIEIDTLVLSGRAAQFPGLKVRILSELQKLYQGKKSPACPKIPPHLLKEVVSIGALEWAMRQRTVLNFEKYPIFGNFGIALMRTDGTWEWKPLFRHDQPTGKTNLSGVKIPTYRKELYIDPSLYSQILFLQSYLNSPEEFIDKKREFQIEKPVSDPKDIQKEEPVSELLENSSYFNKIYALEGNDLAERQRSLGQIRLGLESVYPDRHPSVGEYWSPAIYARVGHEIIITKVPKMEPGNYITEDWWPYNMINKHLL